MPIVNFSLYEIELLEQELAALCEFADERDWVTEELLRSMYEKVGQAKYQKHKTKLPKEARKGNRK